MKSSVLSVTLLVATLAAHGASAVDELPWKAGMSPEQVRSVSEFGPYRAFSNGDLETYKGRWDGRDENFQFYFKDGKLTRVSVDFYEGPDPAASAARWLTLRHSMEKHFGALEPADAVAQSDDAFLADAQSAAAQGTRRALAPAGSHGKPVFALLKREDIEGRMLHFVVLYFDLAP